VRWQQLVAPSLTAQSYWFTPASPTSGKASLRTVIVDLTPEDGNRMMMQTAPGWIASMTDFSLSSAGCRR
jgi:hypothetical protein